MRVEAVPRIAPELPRILAGRHCESDLYLADLLWHACRRVEKRVPFWARAERLDRWCTAS